MATNSIRAVGSEPPLPQEIARVYQFQTLTESAAIVAIVKQFFDGDRIPNQVALIEYPIPLE